MPQAQALLEGLCQPRAAGRRTGTRWVRHRLTHRTGQLGEVGDGTANKRVAIVVITIHSVCVLCQAVDWHLHASSALVLALTREEDTAGGGSSASRQAACRRQSRVPPGLVHSQPSHTPGPPGRESPQRRRRERSRKEGRREGERKGENKEIAGGSQRRRQTLAGATKEPRGVTPREGSGL